MDEVITGLPAPKFYQPIVVDKQWLDDALTYCIDNKVEDLILLSGEPWSVIWSDQIVRVGDRPLTMSELSDIINYITDNTSASLDITVNATPIDTKYKLQVGRGKYATFRVNATGCLGADGYRGIEIVIRPSSGLPPTLNELNVPDLIKDNICPQSGLVIVSGVTGSGKTTLLGATIRELLTANKGRHVITLEQPIELNFIGLPNQTGIISQCEIGIRGTGANIESFEEGIRNILRRHPHSVLLGEARDRESINGAITIGLTGHTCYTTTHTASTELTLPRLADNYSGQDRVRVLFNLIDNTRLIIHQRLVSTPTGIGRHPIRSALVFTQDVRNRLMRIDDMSRLPFEIGKLMKSPEIGIDLLQDTEEQYERGHIAESVIHAVRRELSEDF